MTPSDLHPRSSSSAARPLRSLAGLVLACLPVAAGGGLMLSGGQPGGLALSALVFLVVAAFALRAFAQGYPHDRLGWCNAVTLLRAALASAAAAPLMHPGLLAMDPHIAWAVVAVTGFGLTLDGLDGWLARRSGLHSDFGARFDMEVDSLLALILAVLALANGKVAAWVLVLGGLRYAYLAAGLVWPWLQGALPRRFGRKLVCVIQITVLIALLSPVLPPPAATRLALGATALLVWSFAVDILWLARHR